MAFSPLETKKRSTGAFEVSIATMNQKHRLCTEEVYTVGFVPSYDLPDGRSNSLASLFRAIYSTRLRGGLY